jgi:hypothetical protein
VEVATPAQGAFAPHGGGYPSSQVGGSDPPHRRGVPLLTGGGGLRGVEFWERARKGAGGLSETGREKERPRPEVRAH